MSDIETGGPAFPSHEAGSSDPRERISGGGMTLRDYFAAKAMAALLLGDGTTNFSQRAKEAYDMADAMLQARQQAGRG
jgi:hypothetical protein